MPRAMLSSSSADRSRRRLARRLATSLLRRPAARHLLRAGSRTISWLLESTEERHHGHAPMFRQILLIECVCSVRFLDRSNLNNRIVNMLHLLAAHSCLGATRGIKSLKTIISENSLQILCCKWIRIPLPRPLAEIAVNGLCQKL